jgi:plastocyanin
MMELTAPSTGECRVDLGSPVVGSVGVVIAMRSFSLVPGEVSVRRGTRVTWINCEEPNIDAHTTTSDSDQWDSRS